MIRPKEALTRPENDRSPTMFPSSEAVELRGGGYIGEGVGGGGGSREGGREGRKGSGRNICQCSFVLNSERRGFFFFVPILMMLAGVFPARRSFNTHGFLWWHCPINSYGAVILLIAYSYGVIIQLIAAAGQCGK